jgi:hypothetical protein
MKANPKTKFISASHNGYLNVLYTAKLNVYFPTCGFPLQRPPVIWNSTQHRSMLNLVPLFFTSNRNLFFFYSFTVGRLRIANGKCLTWTNRQNFGLIYFAITTTVFCIFNLHVHMPLVTSDAQLWKLLFPDPQTEWLCMTQYAEHAQETQRWICSHVIGWTELKGIYTTLPTFRTQ